MRHMETGAGDQAGKHITSPEAGRHTSYPTLIPITNSVLIRMNKALSQIHTF